MRPAHEPGGEHFAEKPPAPLPPAQHTWPAGQLELSEHESVEPPVHVPLGTHFDEKPAQQSSVVGLHVAAPHLIPVPVVPSGGTLVSVPPSAVVVPSGGGVVPSVPLESVPVESVDVVLSVGSEPLG